MKRLLLTGSYGSGHNTACAALSEVLDGMKEEYTVLDIAEYTPRMQQLYNTYVGNSVVGDIVYQLIYELKSNPSFTQFLEEFELPGYEQFAYFVRHYRPERIISMHPGRSLYLNKYLQSDILAPIGVVITDAGNVQSLWTECKAVSHYFVTDPGTRISLRRYHKVSRNKIHVSFFPLPKSCFHTKKVIKKDHVVILLTGLSSKYVVDLLALLPTPKVTILKGRSDYADDLKSQFPQHDHEEYIDLKKSLKNIDRMIAKPGGALMCECIANTVPLFAPTFLPGQEEGNIRLLEKYRVGVYEADPFRMAEKLQKDFNANNFKKLANPDSALHIINRMQLSVFSAL